jgi:hypothetical protein
MKRKATLVAPVIALLIGCSGGQSVTNTDNGDSAHVPKPTATNSTSDASAKTNAVGDETYFKKIIESESGLCAIVGLDKTTITLKDKNGHVIWVVNFLTNVEPKIPPGSIFDLGFGGQVEGKPSGLHVREFMQGGGTLSLFIDVDTGKVTLGGVHHLP